MGRIKGWETQLYGASSGRSRRTKRYRVTAPGQPEYGEELLKTKNEITIFDKLVAEGTWRAIEWSSGEKKNAVMQTLEKVFQWRCTTWWEELAGAEHEAGPGNHKNWIHTWGGTTRDASGTKLRPPGHKRKSGRQKKTWRTREIS